MMRGRKDKDKDGDPSAGLDRGLKKRKTSKDAEPTTGQKKKDSTSGSSKDMPQDQAWNMGDNEDEPRDETASRRPTQTWLMNLAASNPTDKSLKDFDELMSTPIDFSLFFLNGLKIKNLTQEFLLGPAFRLLKGTRSNYAELEYDFEECIEDMVPNIWSPIKVAYDKYALWVTHVSVMRKHGYGYLEEIIVRRTDNALYRFKEGDDVADFAIALMMFTRSLVIQKRVEDLQLEVESYQKKINVTKPDTTRPDLRKIHPYTPYKDPQGFIYVYEYKRNRLMRSDELYKFSDGTLTRLLSSLEDLTKNINMEYLPKRRWSNLEKKRAHFMIKDINKLLKERRMMRSLEKFVGGRLYGTDLRLLQRTR
ncbi:hypothetical protein Tco_1500485 [Tanacetum coccineum]